MAKKDGYVPRANPPDITDDVRASWARAEQGYKDRVQVQDFLVDTGRWGRVEVERMTPEELRDAVNTYAENTLMGTDSAVTPEFTKAVIDRVEGIADVKQAQDFLVGTGRWGQTEVGNMSVDDLRNAMKTYAENALMGANSAVNPEYTLGAREAELQFQARQGTGTSGTGTSSGGTGGGTTTGGKDTSTPGGSGGGGNDPNGAGDDPFVVPGSTQQNDTERSDDEADQPDEVYGESDDPHEEPEGEDGDGINEDSDEDPDAGNTESGDGGDGDSDTGTEDDDFTVDGEFDEESRNQAMEEHDGVDKGYDPNEDDDGSSDGGGAGYVLPPGESDYNFNATGRDAILARKGQLGSVVPKDSGDVDPVDDDFGSGVGAPSPRFTKGNLLGGDRPQDMDVGFGGGGTMPSSRNDGVTDPAPDDDVGGGIGPEDDPLAGGHPALKEDAGDSSDADDADDDAADGPPQFSFARSRLEQAIDDGDVDLDGPDLPGHLAVDPD